MRYLDQSTIDEAAEAFRAGIPLDRIAGHLSITVGELRKALDLAPLKAEAVSTEPDLWRADDLDAVL
jgi:hypothetical protein